jgi:hypothetical protein
VSWLRAIWEEFVGLFIDDVAFALAITAWLTAMGALFALHIAPVVYRGPLLFVGLAAILLESIVRRARK